MARIVIADDHELMREGIKSLLAKLRPEWEVCGEAANGAQAIKLMQELKPDLLILDITMPVISGLEACGLIRKLGIACPVLIFTTHQSGQLAEEARKCGANGCVQKSHAARQLIQAMETLLSGGTFFESAPVPEPRPSSKPTFGFLLFRSPVF
jgi:DNA-binding NarL/FixJ family response regulator